MSIFPPKWSQGARKINMVEMQCTETAEYIIKNTASAGKAMAMVFWYWEGVLLAEYLHPKQNVTQERYFDTILWLRNTIKQKRPGKLSQGIFLLQDIDFIVTRLLIAHLSLYTRLKPTFDKKI